MIKSLWMKCAGHVACIGDFRTICWTLIGKLVLRPPLRSRHGQMNNIKMEFWIGQRWVVSCLFVCTSFSGAEYIVFIECMRVNKLTGWLWKEAVVVHLRQYPSNGLDEVKLQKSKSTRPSYWAVTYPWSSFILYLYFNFHRYYWILKPSDIVQVMSHFTYISSENRTSPLTAIFIKGTIIIQFVNLIGIYSSSARH